ncbi:hypothetical protein ACH41E_33450 [Streptomyces sp. NPDC020412]|uniref:hypothetical protein n=1 Tax=Streptomyces sp. NPDC020412 TaxID=3365073 RepID=UPI0037947737
MTSDPAERAGSDRSKSRQDRARAFVPELILEPEDLDRVGPLDPKEQKQLGYIHEARDNYHTARWIRGKALEAAFRRRLFRGEDGQRTRQEYLNDEWDGMSESAAYLEIGEWRLAAQIAKEFGRPAPDSHIRALVNVAKAQGLEEVTSWYVELRQHGAKTKQRVTAAVVERLADFLTTGGTGEIDGLFAPQLPPPRKETTAPAGDDQAHGDDAPFQNLGTDDSSTSRDAADKEVEATPSSTGAASTSDGQELPALGALRAALGALFEVYEALAPEQVAQARAEDEEEAGSLLVQVVGLAKDVGERAGQR